MTYSKKLLKKIETHNSFSIDALHWIGGSIECGSINDTIEQMSVDEIESCFGGDWKWIEDDDLSHRDFNERFPDALQIEDKFGFLAKVHFPFPTNFKCDSTGTIRSWSQSYGHCRIGHFYAETFDELIDKICIGADEFFAEESQKQSKKAEP